MGPTSYSLRPMVCSSSNVSGIVGNEIGLTTTPIECFHGLTNFFHVQVLSVHRALMDSWVLPGPMPCSSSVVPRLVKSVLISAPIE